jgi:hypothetical protein
MSESERRLISIEVPGIVTPELELALGSLRGLVEAAGGQMFDRQVLSAINLLNDDDLRRAATCVTVMRQAGLLDATKQIKDLIIGNPPQRFEDATGYKGLNRQVLHDLAYTVEHDEKIETVPRLLCMTYLSYGRRKVGPNKEALLRQALVTSGMPEEFPWPWKYTLHEHDVLLRGLALIAPTFDQIPRATQHELASILGVYKQPDADGYTPDQREECVARYAERRQQILPIINWEDEQPV